MKDPPFCLDWLWCSITNLTWMPLLSYSLQGYDRDSLIAQEAYTLIIIALFIEFIMRLVTEAKTEGTSFSDDFISNFGSSQVVVCLQV